MSWRLPLTIIIVFLTLFFVGVGTLAGWLYWPMRDGFVIRAVPYAGWKAKLRQHLIYEDQKTAIGLGSPASALVMVTGFWHLRDASQPVVQPEQALEKLGETKTPRTLEEIAQVARELGYEATIKRAIFGVWSLGAYARRGKLGYPRVSPFLQGPTPVIVEQDISSDFPGKGQIFRVVLGVSEGGKEVFVHDYAYRPYFAIPRKDFLALWRRPRRVLVIEPANRRNADVAKPAFGIGAYTSFKQISEMGIRLRTLWYIAEEARRLGRIDEAIDFWEKITLDKDFYKFFNQTDEVYHLTVLMSLYLQKQNYAQVVSLEKAALVLNKDVDRDKAGNQQNAETWLLLGRAFLGLGDRAKAASYAQLALSIDPDNPTAKDLLDQAT